MPSLLERAKAFVQGNGVATALTIAPLALATEVKADPIVFSLPGATISTPSGGMMGHIGQSLFAQSNGVILTGNSSVFGLTSAEVSTDLYGNPPTGYVKAAHAAFSNGHLVYNWGLDYDPGTPQPNLSGQIHAGDQLAISRNFSVAVESLDTPVPVTWKLSAEMVMAVSPTETQKISYVLNSSDFPSSLGTFQGQDSVPILENGEALSWSVTLDIDWHLNINSGQVQGSNPNDRLIVEIPYLGSSPSDAPMYITINQPAGGPSVPTPLPSTLLASTGLLGVFGLTRLRRSRLRSIA